MSQSLLDRYPDCRRHIANLVVVGGANRQQVADELAKKYTLHKVPSTRSVTAWLADAKVRALITELEGIRRDLQPGENPMTLLPEPPDPAEASDVLFGLADRFPDFATLLHRADHDPDFDDDAVRRVLAEGHETDEAFAAACAALIEGYDPHAAMGGEAAA